MGIGSNKNNKKGFTLVEMLVVLVIFSIILIAITSMFISSIRIQTNSLATEQLIDQVNYAVEYMGRAIMLANKAGNNSCGIGNGENYYPVNSPDSTTLKFINNGNCIEFGFNSTENNIYKNDMTNSINLPLTSDDIKVTKLLFNVTGNAGAIKKQSKVTILIEAESKSGNPVQKVKIQTTVSQRDLNK